MKTNSNKKFSRRNDRKVLMAEESTKSWADSDSETSSTSSSSSDSEQEEVHCFMADQTDDDEVFDFANSEFTCEDLVQALNDMVHEYKTLSHTFEEIKAENASLKNSSAESSSDELEDTDSLKTELSRLKIENELLRNEASELKAELAQHDIVCLNGFDDVSHRKTPDIMTSTSFLATTFPTDMMTSAVLNLVNGKI
ncbi:hypothetical protein F511_34105 [Dorcoceras hygrometricum]|uniref:Uncharacterized protein n=1 Tax=Dorcoceras hygrometricum TaxID=472368 RepID=A0A2Z7DCJ2_9LAMI|nr:hypothetical protein F511_34105 [Dorcoceras hygrometricum]